MYEKELIGLVSLQVQTPYSTQNHAYFPIILKDEEEVLKVQYLLNHHNISPRRYFYPSLDTLNYIKPKQYCEYSRDISKRILCLPMYPELTQKDQLKITNIVKSTIGELL